MNFPQSKAPCIHKTANLPLYKSTGGSKRRVPAYASSIALGFLAKETLTQEAQTYVQ